MGSLVISDRTFSQVQEMASTESSTGVMIEGNYRRGKQINWCTASHHRRLCVKQQASLRICSKSLNRFMMDKLHTSTDCKMAGLTLVVAPGWSQHCHNTIQAYRCLRHKSAHLLVSPRQQHTGVLAESLISIFYEGTQRQALEYLPRKSAAYYINYSVSK